MRFLSVALFRALLLIIYDLNLFDHYIYIPYKQASAIAKECCTRNMRDKLYGNCVQVEDVIVFYK